MLTTQKPSRTCGRICAAILVLLAVQGCATRGAPDVGAVVVAPRPQLPPLPTVVEQTPPMPAGYFLQSLKDCCLIDSKRPTPSTPPTSLAAPTR